MSRPICHVMACLFAHCFLLQLSNTKAQDGKTTLLHFLANVVETKHPDVLYFAEEISHIDKASRGEAWVKVFRINPEFRTLRLTFQRKSASKC